MRLLGVDLGDRRVGLAISDPTGTLARPLTTLRIEGGIDDLVAALRAKIDALRREDDGLERIVVGLPRRLDGSDHERTAWTQRVAERLRAAVEVPVMLQDERLTSHEAERRLAERERDWRRRKARLDAAAAAVILQEYLDRKKQHEDRGS